MIEYENLGKLNKPFFDDYQNIFQKTLESGWYVLGQNVTTFERNFSKYIGKSSLDFYRSIKNDVKWIKINFGEVLIFNQALPHGNVINKENETRWSMNCRFKSLYSPYGDKKIGEFFEPITLRAASKIGMQYHLPKIND